MQAGSIVFEKGKGAHSPPPKSKEKKKEKIINR